MPPFQDGALGLYATLPFNIFFEQHGIRITFDSVRLFYLSFKLIFTILNDRVE